MAQSDNLFSGKEALMRLMAGVDKVADAVKGTLGAAGYNALLEHTLQPYSITTNDGVSIAKSIQLADPIENMGANLLKEIASRADRTSNDGTTTAITLAQAILHNGIGLDVRPMEIKNSLEECIPLVEASLKAQAREIDISEVGKVATISAEDETIGNTIQEIYTAIGRDGIIFHDASQTKDSFDLDRGVRIEDCGLASPLMVDMNENLQPLNVAERKNVAIAVVMQKINSINDLQSLGVALQSINEKNVAIFCDDYEPIVAVDLLKNKRSGGINAILIKFPVLWKDWWVEDVAKLTGATVINPALGNSLNNFKKEDLGRVGYLLTNIPSNPNEQANTFLDGTLDISEYIKTLDDGSDEMKLRAARLNKKTARYHVGALTEQALKYRHDKVQDALGSAYQALHGGIVAGGGVALLNASKELPDTIGGTILKAALIAPIAQIMENAGIETDVWGCGDTVGFNAKTGLKGDMFEAGIVDAYTTVMNSFTAAVSVASTVLTAHVITLLPKNEVPTDVFNPYERR